MTIIKECAITLEKRQATEAILLQRIRLAGLIYSELFTLSYHVILVSFAYQLTKEHLFKSGTSFNLNSFTILHLYTEFQYYILKSFKCI